MNGISQTYKNLFLIVIFLFGVLTLYTINTGETPRFILFLGRFHPLLLHLPIGALVVTFFIDIIGRIQKNYSSSIIQNLLGLTALFSIITCFLGYFLSLEGGYQKETLNLHFYTGILTAVLTITLFFISLKTNLRTGKIFLVLFITTLISISVAGHYGSVLTHGENFLTEYASLPKKEKTIETIDSLKIYENVVAKILDEKCAQCHNSSKQKGELSLISASSILKGGVTGPSIIAGNASKSLLHSRLLLPISDKEHMPPEGKEQLTKDEIWLVQHWINQGADFENYATFISKNDTLKKVLQKYLVFNKIVIPKVSFDDIIAVKEAGFRVLELVPGKAELNVKYVGKNPTNNVFDQLSSIEEQIVELELSHSEITDAMISVIKRFENLKYLRLTSKKITDKSLKNLKNLEQLTILNLYNTQITNEGLSSLLTSIQPKQIYVWNTQVDALTASKLQEKYPIKIQSTIVDGFTEKSQLEPPVISPKKTLFIDTIHVVAISRLKDVTLRYTLDGTIPDTTSSVYTNKLILQNSQTFKIAAFKKGWASSEILTREYTKIQHQVANFTMKTPPDKRYPNPNKFFDLKEGGLDFKDGKWVGYFGKDLNTTIDLGAVKTVNQISFSCLENVGSWILYPTKFTVYTSNSKNGTFKKVGSVTVSRKGQGGEVEKKKVTLKIPQTKARFFRVEIKNHDKLPEWHPSAGNPSWLFVDEIYFWE